MDFHFKHDVYGLSILCNLWQIEGQAQAARPGLMISWLLFPSKLHRYFLTTFEQWKPFFPYKRGENIKTDFLDFSLFPLIERKILNFLCPYSRFPSNLHRYFLTIFEQWKPFFHTRGENIKTAFQKHFFPLITSSHLFSFLSLLHYFLTTFQQWKPFSIHKG